MKFTNFVHGRYNLIMITILQENTLLFEKYSYILSLPIGSHAAPNPWLRDVIWCYGVFTLRLIHTYIHT